MIHLSQTSLLPQGGLVEVRAGHRLDRQEAEQLVTEIIETWPADATFDAAEVLEAHPELRGHKSALLDLAYEEFNRRAETGQRPDADSFVAKYPAVQESLRRLLSVHALFSDNPDELHRLAEVWPELGDRFRGFTILEELGRGALSRVFLAREEAVGHRQVVIKVCLGGGGREAETLGRLQHEHIVPIHSVQTDPDSGLAVICMPFLSRVTLFDVLDLISAQGKPPRSFVPVVDKARSLNEGVPSPPAHAKDAFRGSYIDGVLRLGLQMAGALEYTHRSGIFHCDIKPSNVLLTNTGDCLLFDFNLAHTPQRAATYGGTLPYMAPEQLRPLAEPDGETVAIDARVDLFSWGVTLYELLCGMPPFGRVPFDLPEPEIAKRLLAKQASGPFPLQARNPHVDAKLQRLVERCLAPDPSARPANATEVVRALQASLGLGGRTRRFARTHRRAVLAAGCAGAATAVLGAYHLATREPYAIRQMKLGNAALQRGDWDGAIAAFDDLIDADPQCHAAVFGRGIARLRAGRYREAYADLDHAHRHLPHGMVTACLADSIVQIGIAQRDGNRYADARELYENAQRQGFVTAGVLNNTAFCYLHASRIFGAQENATVSLRKALDCNDAFSAIHHNLATLDRTRAIQSRTRPTLKHIHEALSLDPTVPEIHVDAAFLYAITLRNMKDGCQQREDYLSRVAHHCGEAVKLGIAPKHFVPRLLSYLPSPDKQRFAPPPLTQPGVAPNPAVRLIDSLGGAGIPLSLLGD